MATVLLPNSYLGTFNSPRSSRHTVVRTKFLPLKKIWSPLDALGVWLPQKQDYQVIHSINAIPLRTSGKPWIVTFSSIFPRTIGGNGALLQKALRQRLISRDCKKIIALSDYARMKFIKRNQGWDCLDKVLEKLEVIHPNVLIQAAQPKSYVKDQPLQLIFIGNDFARKGGIVALRLAQKAKQMRLPLLIHLVSKMHYGPAELYIDYPDASKYEQDLKRLKLDNVVFHGKKPNQDVLHLLSQCHFQFMPTLHDNYGYSIIEGFSVATPAITTNVCALPEIVEHGKTGYMLHLDLNEERNWIDQPTRSSRKRPEYWPILNSTYDNLAEQALQLLLTEILPKPERYEFLSTEALARARNAHDSQKTGELLDNLYSQAIAESA